MAGTPAARALPPSCLLPVTASKRTPARPPQEKSPPEKQPRSGGGGGSRHPNPGEAADPLGLTAGCSNAAATQLAPKGRAAQLARGKAAVGCGSRCSPEERAGKPQPALAMELLTSSSSTGVGRARPPSGGHGGAELPAKSGELAHPGRMAQAPSPFDQRLDHAPGRRRPGTEGGVGGGGAQ